MPVSDFQIAAYPVTVAQFRAFLDASDSYQEKKWTNVDKEDPDPFWLRSSANHPVTDVSWYDATAFCGWLSAHPPQQVRLPMEAEWQWAAQSAQPGFNYPWAPEWSKRLANTHKSGIGRTTAVGMYPDGLTHQKAADLAGKVWEWCNDLYYRYQDAERGPCVCCTAAP